MITLSTEEIVTEFVDGDNESVDLAWQDEGLAWAPELVFDIAPEPINSLFCANPVQAVTAAEEYLEETIYFTRHYSHDPCDPDWRCPRNCRGSRCGSKIEETVHLAAWVDSIELTSGGALKTTYVIREDKNSYNRRRVA